MKIWALNLLLVINGLLAKECRKGTFDIERTCLQSEQWCEDPAAEDGCLGCEHCDSYDRTNGKCPECISVFGSVTTASSLQCYVGIGNQRKSVDCPSFQGAPIDRCATININGLVTYSCGSSLMADGCTSASGIETCTCKGNNCNGASKQAGFQLIAMLSVSYLINLLLV